MIIGVVVIESGIVTEVFVKDDNDGITVIDLDNLNIGTCPICGQDLKNNYCKEDNVNWIESDAEEIAALLLETSSD